jgi:C4-dicarboxylate transporter, DctM subunit
MLILLLLVLFLILGCFLDGLSIVVLSTSILLPMVKAAGVDPLWFGIFLVVVIEISMVTPPIGFNLFVLNGVTGASIGSIARAAFPFFLVMLLFAGLITVFPKIVTFLPTLMMG